MEGDNNPLALNAWDMSGPNSYKAALEAVDAAIDAENDPVFSQNAHLTTFVLNALYDRVTAQGQANFEQFQRIEKTVTDAQLPYVQGSKAPDELVLFLQLHDDLQSIELARRTIPRVWNTKPIIDWPVRSSLDESPLLATTKDKSPALYRLKNLNVVDTSDQYYVQVDRKRTVRRHFGGKVLTVVRSSIVLHNTDANDKLPDDVRRLIDSERKSAQTNPEYNYDDHSDELKQQLESHIRSRNDGDKPGWIIPILATYYAVKADAVKAERLLEVE